MSEIFQQKGHPMGLKNFSQLARSIIFSNGKEGEKKQANGGIRQKKMDIEEQIEVEKDPDFEPARTDEESDEDDDEDEDGNNSETEPTPIDAPEVEVPNNIWSPYEFHST